MRAWVRRLSGFRTFFLNRIWRNDWRSFDRKIPKTELLYRRFSRSCLVNGKLTPAALKFPKISCCRSKYTDAKGILTRGCCEGKARPELGVFTFLAGHIPDRLHCAAMNRDFQFLVEHVPCNGCFAHSEINTYILPSGMEIDEPTTTVKAIFRAKIIQSALIVKDPV